MDSMRFYLAGLAAAGAAGAAASFFLALLLEPLVDKSVNTNSCTNEIILASQMNVLIE